MRSHRSPGATQLASRSMIPVRRATRLATALSLALAGCAESAASSGAVASDAAPEADASSDARSAPEDTAAPPADSAAPSDAPSPDAPSPDAPSPDAGETPDGDGTAAPLCPQADGDLGSALGEALVTGDLAGGGNDQGSCCCGGNTGEDRLYTWTAPSTGCFRFQAAPLAGDEQFVLVAFAGCDLAYEMLCNTAGEPLDLQVEAGALVVLSVDGWLGGGGAFAVSVAEHTGCGPLFGP